MSHDFFSIYAVNQVANNHTASRPLLDYCSRLLGQPSGCPWQGLISGYINPFIPHNIFYYDPSPGIFLVFHRFTSRYLCTITIAY
jgi:hypothetical protein